jgi:hypothetical protein
MVVVETMVGKQKGGGLLLLLLLVALFAFSFC